MIWYNIRAFVQYLNEIATTMQIARSAIAAIFICTSVCAFSNDACKSLDAKANAIGTRIPGSISIQEAVGTGRVPVYSAPDKSCLVRGVFIVPGDQVTTYVQYNGYTAFMFMNAKTRLDTEGWAPSSRLKLSGYGIDPWR